MAVFDKRIQIGGTFTLRVRMRNTQTNTYVDFSGSSFVFRAKDENGILIPELNASTVDGKITFEENNTRVVCTIPASDTTDVGCKWASYNLVVTWSNGDVESLLNGRLSPQRLIL